MRREKGDPTVIDRIRVSMSELYPEDRKPDPVKAAEVRETLLSPGRKTCKEVSAVFSSLDGIMRRARFDAVSKDAQAREKAGEYFAAVRESGTANERRLAVDYLCEQVNRSVHEGLAAGKQQAPVEIKVSDGKGRMQMAEVGDVVRRTAQMLLTLGDQKGADVLFEAAKELGSHKQYAGLAEKVEKIAKRIEKGARKEAAAEFSRHIAK